jgi:transposase InsO family protein
VEIKAIKEASHQYPELGPWNFSLLLSNEFAVHVSTMSILRVLYPGRYKSKKIDEKVKFYEKSRPHVMYHADTMEVTLGNWLVIHQISVEDDYSRGYMALCVFPKKHSYFVVLTLLRAFRSHSKPELFHHDNGGEYTNGVVSKLLQMLDIVDVPTEVGNPKGNGKKERAHSQDRKYFYDKYHFHDIECVERVIPEYIRFRNESKGQWARYGKTASSVLKGAEAKPVTDEELDRVIRELFFENVERKVKQNGKVKFEGKWYHVGRKMSGETVNVKITLRGVEAWHKGAFIKRWKYWEYVLGIAVDYMIKKYLL